MMRTAPLLFFIALILSYAAFPAAQAFAQVCNPACGSDQICIYSGLSGNTTVCDAKAQNDNASEIVVTGTKSSSGTTLASIVTGQILPIGNLIIGVLTALAFMFFIFGIFRYFFLKGADPKSRAEGRGFIIWGIIGLAVLFSVWGLVHLTLGLIPTA